MSWWKTNRGHSGRVSWRSLQSQLPPGPPGPCAPSTLQELTCIQALCWEQFHQSENKKQKKKAYTSTAVHMHTLEHAHSHTHRSRKLLDSQLGISKSLTNTSFFLQNAFIARKIAATCNKKVLGLEKEIWVIQCWTNLKITYIFKNIRSNNSPHVNLNVYLGVK